MVFETVPSAWLDHETGNVAVYCFHFICRCCQFQGLYSHDRKWRLFQFLIQIAFLVVVWNYWISHEGVCHRGWKWQLSSLFVSRLSHIDVDRDVLTAILNNCRETKSAIFSFRTDEQNRRQPFEQMPQFSERTLLVSVRMQKPLETVQTDVRTVRTDVTILWTDANVFWTNM